MKEPKTKAEQPAVKPTTLFGKLVEILADLGPMMKTKRNPHFGYNYVGEGQVMAELRHRLSDRHIFLFTSVETCTPQYSEEPKAGVFVAVTTRHTFYDADTNETFVVNGAGLGWDSGDKGVYKAITGAMKYALMKNFLVTDEQDPEDGDSAGGPAATAEPGRTGHRRTRPYEEETGAGDKKAAMDLLELKAFLTEHKIPDDFLLQLLREKELIDGHTKNVAGLKPGVLLRCLGPKSKSRLIEAWKAHQDADTAGAKQEKAAKAKPKPEALPKGRKKAAPDFADEPIRTNEGDQTRGRRPIQTDISPADMLGQEGYDNWREVKIHWGDQAGELLGQISPKSLAWWIKWVPKPYRGKISEKDILLDAALVLADQELGGDA